MKFLTYIARGTIMRYFFWATAGLIAMGAGFI